MAVKDREIKTLTYLSKILGVDDLQKSIREESEDIIKSD